MSSGPAAGPSYTVTTQRPPPTAGAMVYDVTWLVDPDVRTVDALARLQLAAGRSGRVLVLRGARGGLLELVDLMGLRDVLPVEAGGEAEEGEEVLRVEEERDLGEPVA